MERHTYGFFKSGIKNAFDMEVPVIGKDAWMHYKNIARPDDLIDIG